MGVTSYRVLPDPAQRGAVRLRLTLHAGWDVIPADARGLLLFVIEGCAP